MFTYWGRRGFSRFALNLARTAHEKFNVTMSISRSNELFDSFAKLGDDIFPVDTFVRPIGALTNLRSMRRLRRHIVQRFERDDTRVVITLMAHVWSPLLRFVTRRRGIKHVIVVHDADAHGGDSSAIAQPWLLREAMAADQIITLSRFVSQQLMDKRVDPKKISAIFHPHLSYECDLPTCRQSSEPLRVLFFGRLLRYKGLRLLISAIELLRERGIQVKIGVFGEGNIDSEKPRLWSLAAEVKNCWIDDAEIPRIFHRYDVVVLSHIEASQSGVAATAFGLGVPVIATPVGGLVEQIQPNVTGIVAAALTAEALANAIGQLAVNRLLI